MDKYTTYEDPRLQGDNDDEESEQDVPTPREVTLLRDSTIGFGFVAGSEKPVIVRFVNEGRFDESELPHSLVDWVKASQTHPFRVIA